MLKQARGKLSRREGTNLFLKGARSFSDKNAYARRPTRPGQHGMRPARLKPYGRQLREKQKVKAIYCMREKQFRRFYRMAEKISRNTKQDKGYTLLLLLELRLDTILYKSGLVKSRPMARQVINHRHISVNGITVNKPSFLLKIGDKVMIRKESLVDKFVADYEVSVPKWIKIGKKEAELRSIPIREELDPNIKEHYIIELYSR